MTETFIALLLGHVLGDYVLQSAGMVARKRRVTVLLLHVAIVGLASLAALGGAPLLVLAGLVGLSRIHLGVHYPSDVLAGALMGLLAGVMLARVFRVSALPEAD